MIRHEDIRDLVFAWGLREDVVEKDYVIGWVLWGIGSDPELSISWVFKGGTCLKKCFLETYRFSEDLDFTVLPGGTIRSEEVGEIMDRTLPRVAAESGIDFSVRAPRFRERDVPLSTEGRIYFRGPRGVTTPASIKLDLNGQEKVVRPSVLRKISHPFPDSLPPPGDIRCYAFEELFAEKIRAMGERCRPRDLYDIINLFRRQDLRAAPEVMYSLLIEKCQSKGVSIPAFAALESSPYRAELESEWKNMLAHQLPALPPLDEFWAELPKLFQWLEQTAAPEELPAMAVTIGEDVSWRPPATIWDWSAESPVPLEPIRFAAVNHLCVELGYKGKKRIIEPYSLRRTMEGRLLIHAIRTDTREHRAYRVDRIESVRVTSRPFTPVYAIEFSAVGPLLLHRQ
jgi:predicted nucleotidyltransferase component of viral defense system